MSIRPRLLAALRTQVPRTTCAAGDEEPLHCRRELVELIVRHRLHKIGDVLPRLAADTGHDLPPALFEEDADPAAVVRRHLAADELAALEAFEQRRDRRAGHV